MLLGQYAVLEFDLARVGVYDGNWNQNMILSMDNVEVIEGVIGERIDDDKTKVFGWDKWFDRDEETMELQPLPGQDEVSEDALPAVESTEAGGNTYRYQIKEGLMEGQDDPVSIGDKELWLTGGKKVRTLAKVLSERGHDIINEDSKNDDFGWLNAESEDEFELREELEGRRIMMWFEDVHVPLEELDDSFDEPLNFIDSVVLDAKTEAGITIKNDESDDGVAESASEETEDAGGDDSEETAESASGSFPAEISDLIEMFARTGQTNRESIESMVTDAAPSSYEVDMDEVMAAIEAEA